VNDLKKDWPDGLAVESQSWYFVTAVVVVAAVFVMVGLAPSPLYFAARTHGVLWILLYSP